MALTQEQIQEASNSLRKRISGSGISGQSKSLGQIRVDKMRSLQSSGQGKSELPVKDKSGTGQVAKDFGIGFLKGIGSTAAGASELGEKGLTSALRFLLPKKLEKSFGVEKKKPTGIEQLGVNKKLEAKGTAQKIGKGVEQIGEFFIPATASTKIGKAIAATTKGTKLARGAKSLAGVAGTEALLGTGQSALQSGDIGKEELKTGAFSLAAPVALSAIPKAASAAKGLTGVFKSASKQQDDAIVKGIEKGIKPYFGTKVTPKARDTYYKKAKDAFKILADERPEIIDAQGISRAKMPESRAEMLQSLSQAKKSVYNQYNAIAKQSGEELATFNPDSIVKNLESSINTKALGPEARSYARRQIDAVSELKGQTPDVIEARIREYNESLAGFFSGRVDKVKARMDASIAKSLNKELDKTIQSVIGKGDRYRDLRNKYSSLKTVEKDLVRQVALEARKNVSGLSDMTDIFTGGDIIAGIVSSNPAQIARGATGVGIKNFLKYLNDPNRYIRNAFDMLDETRPGFLKSLAPKKNVSDIVTK